MELEKTRERRREMDKEREREEWKGGGEISVREPGKITRKG